MLPTILLDRRISPAGRDERGEIKLLPLLKRRSNMSRVGGSEQGVRLQGNTIALLEIHRKASRNPLIYVDTVYHCWTPELNLSETYRHQDQRLIPSCGKHCCFGFV